MNTVSEKLKGVLDDVARTASRCGREPSEIDLLAVSKTFPAAVVSQAVMAGQVRFGENRVQEAQQKVPAVDGNVEWHLIGHLQSNKARLAVQLFNVIETIDSEKVARRVNSCCGEFGKRMRVCIQVNIGEEIQKSGILPEDLPRMVTLIESLPKLDLIGLMTIPPYFEDPEATRPYFRLMSDLLIAVNSARNEPLRILSMGMSHDYRVAIEEGATLIRVGSAIFGPRG